MDADASAISRVLVLGAESDVRQHVLRGLLHLCGYEVDANMAQGVHHITLKTKYYTADLEVHVHAVEHNELLAPLDHDAAEYEAMLWVVDASSDMSFLETERFVGNSVEELEFNVSLLVGADASAASLAQLKRLEQWSQANGFEFVAIDDESKSAGDMGPLHEKRGMERIKEALECNMWASLSTLDKAADVSSTAAAGSVHDQATAVKPKGDEMEGSSASKVLVLGSDTRIQHSMLSALVELSGGDKLSLEGEIVEELQLKTKYYEADVEFHLHRVETNELATVLHHDIDTYEALLWVVDASSDRSFLEVAKFVERSMEELSFEVSLLVGTRADHASAAQLELLDKWCQDNGFEFVRVSSSTAASSSDTINEKEGFDRVLEALHCNMWRSMKMLPRETEPEPKPAAAETPDLAEPKPEATGNETGRLDQDEDPDMQAFSGLLTQVQRIRETGAVLSDEERRRQAERVAMQLWNLLGADDSDQGGEDSD